ncbi:MAG: potassium/proton antiporter [Muribaculaceae bacterium]
MQITDGNIMLVTAALLALSVFVGKAGSKFGMPALLLFLCVGMVAGVDGFGIQFDSAEAVQLIGMISLSIILFSGGVDTKISEIRPIWREGILLATIGVMLTTLITGSFIYFLLLMISPDYNLTYLQSLLLAAIMSSTDSASVFSILNSSRTGLKHNLKPMLEFESGSNDPMAYLLVVILMGLVSTGEELTSGLIMHSLGQLALQLILGGLGGLAIGWISTRIINRLNSDNEFLYPVMMIACTFFAFSLTELIGGNAYLAVYVAGLVVGNTRIAMKHTITTFFGGFTWLVQILMFLSLGLLVNPHEVINSQIIIPGLLLGVFMILAARPLAVFICLLPFRKISLKAKIFISWVGLRGAVPIIFAAFVLTNMPGAESRFMFNMVFFITIISLLVQGTTITRMAQWLGLDDIIVEDEIKIHFPDEITAATREIEVTGALLDNGSLLKDISLPRNTLVIMVKRGNKYLVPTGSTELHLGDRLFIVAESQNSIDCL